MNESQAVTYKTLIKDASYGETGPDERTIAAPGSLQQAQADRGPVRMGAIEVKLSDAKADDGARNLKALERKVLSILPPRMPRRRFWRSWLERGALPTHATTAWR